MAELELIGAERTRQRKSKSRTSNPEISVNPKSRGVTNLLFSMENPSKIVRALDEAIHLHLANEKIEQLQKKNEEIQLELEKQARKVTELEGKLEFVSSNSGGTYSEKETLERALSELSRALAEEKEERKKDEILHIQDIKRLERELEEKVKELEEELAMLSEFAATKLKLEQELHRLSLENTTLKNEKWDVINSLEAKYKANMESLEKDKQLELSSLSASMEERVKMAWEQGAKRTKEENYTLEMEIRLIAGQLETIITKLHQVEKENLDLRTKLEVLNRMEESLVKERAKYREIAMYSNQRNGQWHKSDFTGIVAMPPNSFSVQKCSKEGATRGMSPRQKRHERFRARHFP